MSKCTNQVIFRKTILSIWQSMYNIQSSRLHSYGLNYTRRNSHHGICLLLQKAQYHRLKFECTAQLKFAQLLKIRGLAFHHSLVKTPRYTI